MTATTFDQQAWLARIGYRGRMGTYTARGAGGAGWIFFVLCGGIGYLIGPYDAKLAQLIGR